MNTTSTTHLEIRRPLLDNAASLGPYRAVLISADGDVLRVSVSLVPEEAMTLQPDDAVLWDRDADHLAVARRCCWVVVRQVG